MKSRHCMLVAACAGIAALLSACGAAEPPQSTLKDALKGKFHIGTAMNEAQITGADTAGVRVIKTQFNSVVAENCMKSEEIHPSQGQYDFSLADRFVDFGEQNGMWVIGHTLVWHSQLPEWFTVDDEGRDLSRDELIERMRDHIHTVVGRYKGRVDGWDVVNEAVNDDGTLRQSKFYEIIGEDYIKLAFRFAHEADPDAELYYNDFSMDKPAKREAVVRLVNDLKAAGVRVDGIGMQGHMGMDFPALEDFEKSIEAFAGTGVKVMITELDLSALPNPHKVTGAEVSANFDYRKEFNPYQDGLPESQLTAWNNRMADVFRIILKHRDKIGRVTLWGVSDGDSWKNDWPIPGRTDYALLFDRDHRPKAVVRTIIEESLK